MSFEFCLQQVQAMKLANTAWLACRGHAVRAEVFVHAAFNCLTWPCKHGLYRQVQLQSSLQIQHACRHIHNCTYQQVSAKISGQL